MPVMNIPNQNLDIWMASATAASAPTALSDASNSVVRRAAASWKKSTLPSRWCMAPAARPVINSLSSTAGTICNGS